jgi:glycosyltransferase involved in cell wall biosynthesis
VQKLNKVLLVAFHFPPCGIGSGVHRAAQFASRLGEYGWNPYVLTVNARAYEKSDPNATEKVPHSVSVIRAFALDARKHLSVRGRYLGMSALPDRWANWVVCAIPAGLLALWRRQIDLILVTFPIATAVLIALILNWVTGKPLVVDFRDSMTEKEYPRDPTTRAMHQWIEKRIIHRGSRFIFTTNSARLMYLERYPDLLPSSCIVIPNGYNEDDFADGSATTPVRECAYGRLRLVHSGLIYPDDRDPRAFFTTIRKLKCEGVIDANTLRIDLRASGWEKHYESILRALEIDDVVQLLPSLPHRESLKDAASADGLLLFQAASCNHQIPAKVYEYFRLKKPIFALTSATGDTAALLTEVGGATIAELTDESAIVTKFTLFLTDVRSGHHSLPEHEKLSVYTRRNATAALAHCLDHLMICREIGNRALNEPSHD